MSFISRKSDKPRSLEACKASAERTVVAESIEKITGGTLSGCHTSGLA